MRKQGYRDSTVKSALSSLKGLVKNCDLFDPESVKAKIAFRQVTEGTKDKLVQVYDRFCKQHSLTWTKPFYHSVENIPNVPLECDIDQFIGALSKRQGTFVQLLKETGARAGEAWALKWEDVRAGKIVINSPEKNSRPRVITVSDRLVSLISSLPHKCRYVFRYHDKSDFKSFQRRFYTRRKFIANTLENPKILLINMKSLRHYKASTEYRRTKDILYVKELLGHKRIENTLVYTHLLDFEGDDSFIVKIASTIQEFTQLLESGFEYVSDYEGKKILRKRK